ncbi:MAG TPA: ATP-binding protein [Mycobacteriales bacterium]|nr:ATP-binding protein [Mycobacteriales bacterium]
MSADVPTEAYEDIEVRASLGLPWDVLSARRARRFISEFSRAADLDQEVCDRAALLVSELVTNAVIHGRSRATLVAERPGGHLRIAVLDTDLRLPVGPGPLTLDAESGRGLRIVDALADRWGVEAVEGGKAIWFELDL